MNCEICGAKMAKGCPEGYRNHLKKMHNAQLSSPAFEALKSKIKAVAEAPARPKLVPLNTSGRSKAQIVHDMEKVWGKAVYPEVKPWHSMGVTQWF